MNAARAFTMQGFKLGPNSFSDVKVISEGDCPPPKNLSNDVLLRPLPTSKAELITGLVVNEEGSLVCTDQAALDKQKGVL